MKQLFYLIYLNHHGKKVVRYRKCQTIKEGVKLMKNVKTNLAPQKKNGAKLLLDALSIVAEKNATTLCRGLMYEPEIPEKLRK